MSSKDQRRHGKMARRKKDPDVREHRSIARGFWKKVGGVGGTVVFVFAIAVGWNTGFIQTSILGGDAADHSYTEFAQCLTDADLVMYGTDWCPYCQDQKRMFDDAFEFIDYVNCDFNSEVCDAKRVRGYPTWFMGNKFLAQGVQTFDQFAEATGCELPEGVE